MRDESFTPHIKKALPISFSHAERPRDRLLTLRKLGVVQSVLHVI
jgi:hypothetical protein